MLAIGSFVLALVLATRGAAQAQPASESEHDRALSMQVVEAMAREPSLQRSDITVRTRAGAVHLSGTVATVDDIKRAAAAAWTVRGVRAVRNGLRLEDSPSRA